MRKRYLPVPLILTSAIYYNVAFNACYKFGADWTITGLLQYLKRTPRPSIKHSKKVSVMDFKSTFYTMKYRHTFAVFAKVPFR
jgi:hypothetical protein